MSVEIQPEKSLSGNFNDYSVVAAVENLVASMPIMSRQYVKPIERIDGTKDESFNILKTHLQRIRKKSGLVVRMSVQSDHAIIQRIK